MINNAAQNEQKQHEAKTRSPKLSIVVLNYRTPTLTKRCVESIFSHKLKFSFEIIVVNNGYSSVLDLYFKRTWPQVTFHQTGFNGGFAMGVNQGLLRTRGKYLLLLNSDATLPVRAAESMVDYLEAHSDVGILGPREEDDNGHFVPSCGRFPNLISEMVRKIIHYRLSVNDYRLREHIDEQHKVMSEVDWISGSCLLMRREVLYDTGLLDEQFFMYFEDIDFCQRAFMQGWKIRYLPEVTIHHDGGQSARLNIMKVMLENRRSQLYFSQKHHGNMGVLIIKIFLLTKYGFNFIKWSLWLVLKKCLRQEARSIYARTLISKKVIELCFKPRSLEPKVARFHPYINPAI
ncbi:MAG: GT2 family glycosyltransferase [Candidatus Omnitrophota bacterium]|jgi:GT2 family glycosyltransferase